jgi:outer membrane protein assembly factor BamB
LLAIPIARWAIFETDHQYANLAAGGLGLLAIGSLGLVWMLRASNAQRLVSVVVVAIAATAFYCCFELKGFTGETLPDFGWRPWIAPPKKTVDNARIDADSPQTEFAKSAQFLQFLGSQRSGVIDEPSFDIHWSEHPPKLLWKKPIGAGWSGFVAHHSLAYTMYQDENDEVLAAFDLVSGELRWSQRFPGRHYEPLGGLGPRATPTLYAELVLSQTATGTVVCCNAISGEVLWTQDVLKMGFTTQEESEALIKWGRSASPLIIKTSDREQVIVPMGGKSNSETPITLVSMELRTGDVLWKQGTAQIGYSSPALIRIGTDQQIVSVNENNVTGHDLLDGKVLWTTDWVSHSNSDACASQPVSLEDGRILLGKGYAQGSKMIRLERSSDESTDDSQRWSVSPVWQSSRVLKTKFTNAIYYDKRLFALSDGVLECVDPENGKRLWRGGRFGQGQLLVVNGKLLVSAEDGRIILANREDGTVVHEQQILDGITWNYPAVAGPFVLVRNGTEMACLYSPVQQASQVEQNTRTVQ